jgi:sugar phosphate isomerase/epimerase
MTWDLALPSDPIEGNVIHEDGDYKVIEWNDHYLCYEGDREVHDYGNEYSAIVWFYSVSSRIDDSDESQEESDREWEEFHAMAQEIDVERMLEEM